MDYEIYIKSTLDISQLITSSYTDNDGIEIQLPNSESDIRTLKDRDFEYLLNYNVKAVHCPLNTANSMHLIEGIANDKYFARAREIFEIAEFYGSYHGSNVLVIYHTNTSLSQLEYFGNVLNTVVRRVVSLLYQNPHVILAIENTTPMIIPEDRNALYKPTAFLDNVELVEFLRNALSTDRIGTVLNTRRALVCQYYLHALYTQLALGAPNDMIRSYCQKNNNVIKLVRASGVPETPGHNDHDFVHDASMLFDLLNMHDEYIAKVPITIEANDTDTTNLPLYKHTRRLVRSYYRDNNE